MVCGRGRREEGTGKRLPTERTREMKSYCARPALICFALVDAPASLASRIPVSPCFLSFFPHCHRFPFSVNPFDFNIEPCDTTSSNISELFHGT